MTSPEDALAQARAEAERLRRAGTYPDQTIDPSHEPDQAVSTAKLMEWAVIAPELRDVRSTRRYGAPMTALKRGLVRLLAQYHAELTAQQTRFNVNLLARVTRLEERIDALERAAGPRDAEPEPPAG